MVSSILVLMAFGAWGALHASGDDTLELGRASGAYCSDEKKNDRVVWYLPWILGCSRRTATVPLPGDVGMRSPCRLYKVVLPYVSHIPRCLVLPPRRVRAEDTSRTVDVSGSSSDSLVRVRLLCFALDVDSCVVLRGCRPSGQNISMLWYRVVLRERLDRFGMPKTV